MELNVEELNALWKEPWMWDTVIICEGGAQAGSAHGAQQAGQEEVNDNAGGGDALSTFFTEKSLLATESTWFRSLICGLSRVGALDDGGTQLSPFSKPDIVMFMNEPQVPRAHLSVILNFLHTGEFNIENQERISALIKTARYLGMARVIDFLEKKLVQSADDASSSVAPIQASPATQGHAVTNRELPQSGIQVREERESVPSSPGPSAAAGVLSVEVAAAAAAPAVGQPAGNNNKVEDVELVACPQYSFLFEGFNWSRHTDEAPQ